MLTNFIKNFFYELHEFFRFQNFPIEKKKIIFYSENENQWDFFESIIKNLSKKKYYICYVTSSRNEKKINRKIKGLNTFYIGSSFLRTIFFKILNTNLLIMSLPDLNKFEIRRSKYPVKYIFIPHNVLSTHMVFREGAFEAFDVFFCCGPHHYKEIRETEKIYKLKKKRLVKFGYSRLDKIISSLKKNKNERKNVKKINVLIAPSWGEKCLFERGAEQLIDFLKKEDFNITLRPHPDTLRLNPKSIKNLLKYFKNDKNVIYDPKISSINSYLDNDILISDWSGAAFEFAFGSLKPVIFLDLPKKINNKNYNILKNKPVEIEMRGLIGKIVKQENLKNIGNIVKTMVKEKFEWKKKLLHLRNKKIYNLSKSGKIGSEFISNYLKSNRFN